jgi:hypothetical protein
LMHEIYIIKLKSITTGYQYQGSKQCLPFLKLFKGQPFPSIPLLFPN